jgi:succinate-semialdehyde dehydrogenase/glutarate-semialdehyde dehydrogenase
MEAGKHLKGSTGFGVMMCLNMKMPRWKTEWAVVGRTMVKVVLPGGFIAVEAIADEFIQKFKDALSKLSGDPMDPATN